MTETCGGCAIIGKPQESPNIILGLPQRREKPIDLTNPSDFLDLTTKKEPSLKKSKISKVLDTIFRDSNGDPLLKKTQPWDEKPSFEPAGNI